MDIILEECFNMFTSETENLVLHAGTKEKVQRICFIRATVLLYFTIIKFDRNVIFFHSF